MNYPSRRHQASGLERHFREYENIPYQNNNNKDIPNLDMSDPNEINDNKPQGATASWLDDLNGFEGNQRRQEPPTSSFGSLTRTGFFNSDTRTLENELSEQKIQNSRLQTEIINLTNQIKALKNSSGTSTFSLGSEISKLIPLINYEELGMGKKIGQGGYSEIFEAKWLSFPVAVKVISNPKITQDLIEEFNNEIEKLFLLRHPYIINIYGICPKNPKLAVVTELASKGSLFNFIHNLNKGKDINDKLKLKFTSQLINVVFYIHQRGYVHRDLKTQNILLDDNYNIKICDFGLTKLKTELNLGSFQFAGTQCYMAPELFEKKFYDEKVDVFALGTIIWEIFNQKIPYCNCDGAEIKQKVCRGDKLESMRSVPKKIVELIDKCRSLKPDNRPRMDEIIQINLE